MCRPPLLTDYLGLRQVTRDLICAGSACQYPPPPIAPPLELSQLAGTTRDRGTTSERDYRHRTGAMRTSENRPSETVWKSGMGPESGPRKRSRGVVGARISRSLGGKKRDRDTLGSFQTVSEGYFSEVRPEMRSQDRGCSLGVMCLADAGSSRGASARIRPVPSAYVGSARRP
jgi:hypothetical protein